MHFFYLSNYVINKSLRYFSSLRFCTCNKCIIFFPRGTFCDRDGNTRICPGLTICDTECSVVSAHCEL